MLCAAPSYIADRGMPTHPDELAHGHKVVGYFSARTGRRIAFDVMRGAESYDLDLPYAMATNDSTAYLAAALAGSRHRAGDRTDHPALYRVRRAGARAAGVDQHPAQLHVVYAPNRHLSSRLRVFVDWVAELFTTNRVYRRPGTAMSLFAAPGVSA